MNLRGRITLILSLSILLLVTLLLVEGRTREAALADRLNETVLDALEASWEGLTRVEQQRMLRYLETVRSNGEATAAFVAYDAPALSLATLAVRTALRTDARTTGIQGLRRDGTAFFDTRETRQRDDAILTRAQVETVMTQATPLGGLVLDPAGRPLYVTAAPVFGRGGPVGVLVLYTPAVELIDRLAEIVAAPTVLLGPDGKPRSDLPPDSLLRPALQGLSADAQGVSMRKLAGRDVRLAALAVRGAFAEEIGRVVSLRDVTDATRQRALLSGLSYFGLGCAILLFLAAVNWYLRRSFRPLNGVIRSLNALSAGRTDVAVPVPERDDEIGRLAGTFESFRTSVEASARLNKLQQELDVAARIQRQILPSRFPQAPQLDFAARMTAARDVGGDFYDAFELPDGRIGCVIADVSDKGMGAALFMAASRTVIRSVAATTADAAECLARANRYLAAENDAMMFVTVFYAIVDPQTGRVAYCNAGHNPPARISRDGSAALLPTAGGPALGVFETASFVQDDLVLAPGERLFLYTDGITEAMNRDRIEFGEARMLDTLSGSETASAEALTAGLLAAVDRFVAGAEQSDDITCLTIAYEAEAPKPEAHSGLQRVPAG